MQVLLDNQLSAIEKLRQYKVGALFMDAGTGKTRSAMELVKSVEGVDLVLWLAPFRSINPKVDGSGIQDEVAKWGGFDCETVFCGIETLSSSDRTYLELYQKLEIAKRPFIVVDESLKVKNWKAKRTQRIIYLGKLAEYKLILNGTPISRNLLDLWAQMWFLSPRILNMDIAEFKNTFCEYTTMTKRIGRQKIKREWINRYHNVDHLYSLIDHYVFEADLQLNVAQQWMDIPYTLDDEHRSEYQHLKEKYLDNEKMEAMNNNIFLEMTMKMQHTYSCSSEKLEAVDRLVKEHGSERILIYYKFVDSKHELESRYPDVTVLSIQSDTMSLNLQQKNVTIFFDKTWDYATIDQAMHRTWRTGQLSDCLFYTLTGDVGLEKLINKNVAKKESLLDYFKKKSVEQLKKEL